jgi:competence protein ComEA
MEQPSPPWRVFDAPPVGTTAANERAASDQAAPAVLAIQPVAMLGVVGAIAIGIVAVVIAAGSMGSDRVVDGPGAGAGGAASSDPDPVAAIIVVDVSGAVVNPGLYRLPAGSRSGDAVQAAGGYGPRVDVERLAAELNLAATLTDGAQIRVPSRDDPTPGAPGGGADGEGGGGNGLIDLNKASQSELESLPGIGPVTATKIIAARDEAPFRSINELRERGLVGEKTFESIRALITVG